MRSNDILQMTDTHRLSPQTTSSSGYHSDLSSTNQSPQSIHENPIEPSTSLPTEKKTNKNVSRISNFLRNQYERAKSKLISSKQRPSPPVSTCSKSTSTTALANSSENNQIKSQQSLSSIQKRSSFIEPVKSIYVPPSYDKQIKMPLKNSSSNQLCYSRPPPHRLSSYLQSDNSHVNSHSYRRVVALSNYENISTQYLANNPYHYYVKPRYSQDYYPYKYLNKNYHHNRSIYVPLSDFISTPNSAFKPIKPFQYPVDDLSEQITSIDDPCDLEVAQYFQQTPQWSNPNYYDIYKKEMPVVSTRKNYTETLC